MDSHELISQRKRSRWFKLCLLSLMVGAVVYLWRSWQERSEALIAESETAYRVPTMDRQPEVDETSTAPVDNSSKPTLEGVMEYARQLRAQMQANLVDYTATLIKRERIRGKLGQEDFMDIKIRQPRSGPPATGLSAYLKFIAPSPTAGREVIWVDGRDDSQLVSYQFGLLVKLAPTNILAMAGNKYPISEIGLMNMVDKLLEKGAQAMQSESAVVELFENQMVDGRACQMIQVTHPDQQPQFEFHIAQVFIDQHLQMPIRYAAYLWPEKLGEPAPLEEEYTYKQLKINVGLTDADFDYLNPNYKFPK